LLNLLLFPGRAKFQAEKISKSIGGKPVWLIELQAEPWGPVDNKFLSPEEAAKSMDISKLRKNIKFVAEAGFDTIIVWGIEHALLQKDRGHPELWDELKRITTNK